MFDCPGEMSERLSSLDWSGTPLGPIDQWPQSLRTTVAILLRSRFPMILSWGEEFVMLYNDAYIPVLGTKHPDALGSTLAIEFAEIWDEIGPMQRSVLNGEGATFHEDLGLVIERGSGPEENFFTFSYSHVPSEEGSGGVLAVLAMTTGKVVAARRLSLLNALSAHAASVNDVEQAVTLTMAELGEATADLTHGSLFVLEDSALVSVADFGEIPSDWPTTLDPDDPVVEEGATPRVPIRLMTGDDTAALLLLGPHPLRPLDEGHRRFLDLVGEQVRQALVLSDARAKERARLKALAEIDAAKTAFLSNVSHEFRTPLTLILGPLEDAINEQRGVVAPDELDSMHQSAHRLLRMVNGLLDVARMEAGTRAVDREHVDVAELSKDLLRPFEAAAVRSGLTLEVHLDPELGSVETDPRLWETILLNLTANAVKYTMVGSVQVTVARVDRTTVIRVVDTGIGIPAEDLPKVFDRFHRVQGREARSIEGTGLGLALVQDAVGSLGGEVSVSSSPGEGTTFEVRLPVRESEIAPSPITSPSEAHVRSVSVANALAREIVPETDPADLAPASDPEGSGPCILVVDDNVGMRARLVGVLSPMGRVITCVDGQDALETMGRETVDLVITDVMMPRLDGLGLLKAIRASEDLASTPVLLLSARAGAEAATEALEAGADDYVVKPFTRTELLARARANLELSTLRQAQAAALARNTMLAGVSHDMQTPLSVVTSSLEMLSSDKLPGPMREKIGYRARLRADQLDRLVRQFLDWSRLSAGSPLLPHVAEHDLVQLVGRVTDHYDSVEVTSPEAASTMCDLRRTEQILHNLIINAQRAARSRVEVRLVPQDAGYDIEVHDDGHGVDPAVLPRLFSAFGPSANGGGNGLGLHVSREAARAQGGDLVLGLSQTTGSVFVLHLRSEA
ncbi:hypothetical protein GCM10027020_04660 [Nocardioides salsibiostraticola]